MVPPPTLPSFRRWLDQRCAAARSGTFLEIRGERWSYADLARITDSVARALHERGVAPGDRVAIRLPNGPEHLFAWLGAAKLGATVAPLHAQWTDAELTRALAQLRPKLVIGEGEKEAAEVEALIAGKDQGNETVSTRYGREPDRDRNGEAFLEGKDTDKEAVSAGHGREPDRDRDGEAFIEGKDTDKETVTTQYGRELDRDRNGEAFIEGKNTDKEAASAGYGRELDRTRGKEAFIEGNGKGEAMTAAGSDGESRPPFSSPCDMSALDDLPLLSFFPSMKVFASSFSSSSSSSFAFASTAASSSDVAAWMADRSGVGFPPVPEVPADSPAELLFTSGTTGLPKAAVQSFRSMILTGEAFADWLRLSAADRLFTCLPLAHVNARFYSTMGAIAAGAALVVEEKFSASAFWRWLSESRATVVNTIGAMLRILLQAPASPLDRAHSLRLVYTSPALGAELHRAFEQRFDVRLVVGYGMTECTFGFIHPLDEPLDSPARHLDSMGRPRRHPDPRWPTGWRLVDPATGAESSSGEIQLLGPTVFSGYLDNPEATAAAFTPDGWLRTGDLAARDEAGWWTFVARSKEMIRRRGENLSPLEVEEVLMSHPAVAEAAVLGVPSALGDEDVAAFVVLRRDCAPACGEVVAELATWCAAHLARFKVPTEWRLLEALPRTSTNRVAKSELLALHQRDAQR